MRLLQDMLSNLMRGTMGLSAFGRKDVADLSSEPQQAVKAVLSATGEVSSLVYAENLLNIIEALDDVELAAVLVHLLDNHDINAQALAKAATTYATAPTHAGLEIIANGAEPGWMELFRRLNATTNGTVRLVHFRERFRCRERRPSIMCETSCSPPPDKASRLFVWSTPTLNQPTASLYAMR